MANRHFVSIFLIQTCFYHVVRPSGFAPFATSGRPKQINRLDIRTFYPGLHSTTGFTAPYSPNTESAPRILDQAIPSQIVSTEPLSNTMGSILPNPSPSNYQTSVNWTKRPGFNTASFIRGVFQAADSGRRMTSPISSPSPNIEPACRASESVGSNFHESPGSNTLGRGFSGYRCSNSYDDSASCVLGSNGESVSSKTQSECIFGKPYGHCDGLTSSHNRLRSSISESVLCKSRSDSNLGGACCNKDGSTSSYRGLGSNGEPATSKTQTGCNYGRPYSNYDVSTSSNSGFERSIGESVSSKSKSDSNLGMAYSSYDGLVNSLGEFVPSKSRTGSNFGGPYCSYSSKNYHGPTNSNESTNGSDRMGSYGGSDHGAVGVAGQLPVVGRTTVAGRVPITGGVKFNGFIPAAGRVTIGGSCYCGPPFAF